MGGGLDGAPPSVYPDAMSDKDSFQHSPGYLEDFEKRRTPRALAGGVQRLRQLALEGWGMWPRAGEDRSEREASNSRRRSSRGDLFEQRVKMSTLRNVWFDAVKDGAWSPFRHAIQLEGWSPELQDGVPATGESPARPPWTDSISAGMTIDQYMKIPTLEQAVDGIHFTLVDLPIVKGPGGEPKPRSRLDDDVQGIRPFWVPVPADHFDPLIYDFSRNLLILCGVFLKKEHEGEAVWRLYRLVEEEEVRRVETRDLILEEPRLDAPIVSMGPWLEILPLGAGQLSAIPIVPYYGNWDAPPFRAGPPFRDAADVNIGTWRKRSDKDDLARRTARPRTFQSGVDVDKDDNPRHQMRWDYLYSTKEGADAKMLETTGAALAALRADVIDDEEYIRQSVHAIQASKITGGPRSATEVNLEGIEAASYRESVIVGNTESIAQTLRFTEELGGISLSGGTVSWRHDVISPVAEATLQRLREMHKEGKFSTEGLLELERRSGGLPEDFNFEREKERLLAERQEPGALILTPRGWTRPGVDPAEDEGNEEE